MSAHSWSRVARLGAVLAALLSTPAGAQSFGTMTTSLSRSWDAWYWGNYNVYNDCNQGAMACGPGNQSSTTFHSFANGFNALGASSASGSANGGFGGTGGLTPNFWYSYGDIDARWWDTITLNSISQAPGTFVDVTLSILFSSHGSGLTDSWFTSAFMGYSGSSTGSFGTRFGYQGLPGSTLNRLYTYTLHQQVGSTFSISGATRMWVQSESATGYMPPTGATNTADVQALFYVDVDPAWSDVTLSTASGQNYGTPGTTIAPEPASFALVLTGIGACVVARRRRRER